MAIPKLPTLPQGASIVQIRSKGAIQAEKDARIAKGLSQGRPVSPAEQHAREASAEQRKRDTRKGMRGEAKIADSKIPPKVSIATQTTVRASMSLLTGEVRPMSADTGAKLLAAIVSVLRDDSSTTGAKLAEGVCLALWVHHVNVNAMTGHREEYSVCISRKFYATVEGAHAAGKAALAEDRATSFTVNPEVRRADVLSGDRPIARDLLIPSRKRGAICQGRNYNKGAKWQKAAQTRVTFSHG